MFQFSRSHTHLDKLRFPRLEEYTKNSIITNVDFAEAKAEGRIEYRDDGVYLNYKGKWIRGFYYMTSYRLDFYNKVPSFHLFNCRTMQSQHLFKGKYIWSNAEKVDVRNRDVGNKMVEDLILPICGNCRILIEQNIIDTKDFYASTEQEEFDINDIVNDVHPDKEKNIFGYPMNWKEIAAKFKQKKGLKCKDCGLKDQSGENHWFYDVDHINGNKSECAPKNLQVLCKLCHTYKDKHHRQQAIKYPHRNESLHELVRTKFSDLSKNNNLKKYLKDFDKFLQD